MEHTETQGQKLEAELNRIGFLGDGGTFSFRTEAEEREFLTVLELYGCKSVTPRAEVWNGILLPFVEGINLMEQLFAGGTTGIQPALDDICRAHTHGIVYGDRWPKNIIVRPDGDITQIDFDIHVSGQYAPELELAQFLFGCIRDASRKELVFQVIRRTLSVIDFSDYNVLKIQEYLDKYVERYVCKNYDEDSHFLSVQQAGYHLEQLLSRLTYRTHR